MEIPKGCLDIYLLYTNCVYKQQSMIRPIKINADHIFHAQNVRPKKKNGNLFSNVSQESASNDHLKFKYPSLNFVICRFQKSVPKLMQFFL